MLLGQVVLLNTEYFWRYISGCNRRRSTTTTAAAAAIRTPLALGESYRSLRELQPFLPSVGVLQPDLGRCGITGSLRISAAFPGEIVPHLSIAMGPQIAAALHFAAATPNCPLCEFNPHVFDSANGFLRSPLVREGGEYHVSAAPGLGIEWNAVAVPARYARSHSASVGNR